MDLSSGDNYILNFDATYDNGTYFVKIYGVDKSFSTGASLLYNFSVDISVETETPDNSESQVIPYISPNSKTIVEKDGFLWFIINDEMPGDDKVKTRILWQDNLGMFNVNVLRKRD